MKIHVLILSLMLSSAWCGAAELWSGTRTIKKIESEEKPTYKQITIYVDDHFQGVEEVYGFKYACSEADCYNNSSDGAKIVSGISL